MNSVQIASSQVTPHRVGTATSSESRGEGSVFASSVGEMLIGLRLVFLFLCGLLNTKAKLVGEYCPYGQGFRP